MTKRLLAMAALTAAGFGFVVFGAAQPANATQCDPGFGGPGCCQFLGQNYNVWYPCDEYQPWLPYGTANNPPISGSAPGFGDTWSPNCPACSS